VRYSKIQVLNAQNQPAYSVEMGEKVRFALQIKVSEPTPELYAVIALRSGISREFVTTFRHKLPFTNMRPHETYEFECVINTQNLRPGEYPIYFWLGDDASNAYDVVDDVVAPLIVAAQGDLNQLGFDASTHSGYFSVDAAWQ
jgi:hypothetical protein